MTKPEYLEKEWLKRAVLEEYYGNAVSEEMQEYLGDLYEEVSEFLESKGTILSKKQYADTLALLEELVASFEEKAAGVLDEQRSKMIEEESRWLKDFLKGVGLSILIPKTIVSQVVFSMSDIDGINDIPSESGKAVVSAADKIIRTSYLIKSDLKSIADKLKAIKNKSLRNLETAVKTFCTSVFRNTDRTTFRFNRLKVRYSAVLDSHVCLMCASMHGQVFDSVHAPLVPQHHRCRCTLVPVIGGETGGFATFSDWISSLDDDELHDVLGKGRYNLYKNGFPADKFVDSGRILTLKELSELPQKKKV